jgi:hypothetical protein
VSDVVKVGQIAARLDDPPDSKASVECGHVVVDVGYAAGYRFFTELTKIRAALAAAHAVITERRSGAATPAEVHLASLLVDLEVP